MQRRGAVKVHQHHRKATGAEGEGRVSELGFVSGPFNNTVHDRGNATIAQKLFDEPRVKCIV